MFNKLNLISIFYKLLFLFLVIFIVEMPINDWIKYVVFSVILFGIFFKKIEFNNKKVIFLIFLLLFTIIIDKLIKKDDIIVRHGLFFPNELNNLNTFVNPSIPENIYNDLKEIFVFNNSNLIQVKEIAERGETKFPGVWSFVSDGIWNNDHYGIKLNKLNFKSKFDAKPGVLNTINLYSNLGEKSYEFNFPLIFSFNILHLVSDKICWQGIIYYPTENKLFEKLQNNNLDCKKIDTKKLKNNFIFAVDFKGSPEFKISFESSKDIDILISLLYYLKYFIIILLSVICFKINIINFISLLFINLNYFIFYLDQIYFEGLPSKFSSFIYLQRGNDGIGFYTKGREGLMYLLNGNFIEFLKGGANIFYNMPGMSYLSSILLLFFGESFIGHMLIISFIPFVIYLLIKKLINRFYAIVLFWIFLIFPIFEAFGFLHFYYAKLTLKGFGGSFGYLFFFLAIMMLIPKNSQQLINKNYIINFLSGFCLFLTVLFRPNYFTFCVPFLLSLLFLKITKKRFQHELNNMNLFYLFFGFSFFLLIPFHNYYFGNEVVLFTSASTIPEVLKIHPSMLLDGLMSIIYLNPNIDIIKNILNNLRTWIDFYEFWLFGVYITLWFAWLNKKNSYFVKALSFSLIISHFNYLFYAGDPRYVYGLWCISFIVFLSQFKKFYWPYLYSKYFKNVIISFKFVEKIDPIY